MNENGANEPTKDLTENLSDRQVLLLLLERVTGIDERGSNDRQMLSQLLERVAHLEAAEEDRKRETRPLWQRLDGQMTQMLARLLAIEDEQRRMRHEMGLFREDLRNERMERSYIGARVDALERSQPSQQ